jgi:hypothetical protein
MTMREQGRSLTEIRRIIDGKHSGTPTPTPRPPS